MFMNMYMSKQDRKRGRNKGTGYVSVKTLIISTYRTFLTPILVLTPHVGNYYPKTTDHGVACSKLYINGIIHIYFVWILSVVVVYRQQIYTLEALESLGKQIDSREKRRKHY